MQNGVIDYPEWEAARQTVESWLKDERPYVHSKWGESKHELQLTQKDVQRDVMMYVHRAFVLGLENPLGRQALMKAHATMQSYVEATVRMFGPPPKGGVSSGEVVEWDTAPSAQ